MNKSELKSFLESEQFRPIKKLGQNFLIRDQLALKIANRVKQLPPPFVEIGPGAGALTRHFTDRKQILLVEQDPRIADYWRRQAYSVIQVDALRLNWSKLPKSFTLFGNLPYQIASSLVLKAVRYQKQVQNMLFLVQKEVGQRMRAVPKSKTYGFLSVGGQLFWDISKIEDVKRVDFYPMPKVEGQVLSFQAKALAFGLVLSPEESQALLSFVKKCFSFKRKMLFKQIPGLSYLEGKKALKELNLSEGCRAEELSPSQFIELYLEKSKVRAYREDR